MNVLFHVGLAKAGSTYLQRWFDEHPDIVRMDKLFPVVSRGKWVLESEPRLVVLSDERFASWIKHQPTWTKRLDTAFDVKDYQRHTRDFLHSLCPDANVLLVTRAPSLGLLKSIYSQYVKTGGDLGFDAFMEMVHERIRDAFNYEAILELYSEKFSPEKLQVLPMELMQDDLDGFLDAVETRFNLSKFRLPPVRINPSLTPEEMWFYPRINGVLAGIFGDRAYRMLMLYIKVLSKGWLRPIARFISVFLRNQVDRQFENADHFLSSITPRTATVADRSEFGPYRSRYVAGESGGPKAT